MLLVPWRLALTLHILWTLLDSVFFICSTQTPRRYMRQHFLLQQMMAVSCCHALPHLHLDWFNHMQDCTIFHQGPVCLPVLLITLRRQSLKLLYIVWEKNLQCLLNSMQFPGWSQAKNRFFKDYSDVFDGIGCFPGPQYHIQWDTNVTPKETPCWPIPAHLKEAFKQEIDKMLKEGVSKPVLEATPWINSFILVEGKISLAIWSIEYVWILQSVTKW